jgi:DNA-binding response OmpR family regulator
MAKTIMIIDDDRTTLILEKTRLEANHYEVLFAFDGEEALRIMKKNKPDLIVLDIQMPNMNGYTFILELQKIKDFKNIPIIILTAHDSMQPIFELKGVKDYLVKPVNMEQLLGKIQTVLTNS